MLLNFDPVVSMYTLLLAYLINNINESRRVGAYRAAGRCKHEEIKVDVGELMKAKNIKEIERLCSRVTGSVEEDLKKRLYVYEEDKHGSWKAGMSDLNI
jgi:hypothetical protein